MRFEGRSRIMEIGEEEEEIWETERRVRGKMGLGGRHRVAYDERRKKG